MRNLKKEIAAETVEGFRPMVDIIASQFMKRIPLGSAHKDELVQWGMIGLLDALKRWNPEKNTKFSTYAEFRIRGQILDEIRDLDWVPRSIRDKAKELEIVRVNLEARFQRPPRDCELAKALGQSMSQYFDFLNDVRPVTVNQIEDVQIEDQLSLDLGDHIDRTRLKQKLTAAIDELPERQRLVLALYYFEELTLKEIGWVLRVSESRISQLQTAAVKTLREKLKGADLGGYK